MSIPLRSSSFSAPLDHQMSCKEQVIRSTMTFHPSIWGDQFLFYHQKEDQARDEEMVKELQDEVRKELVTNLNEPSQHMKLMELIDAIQRLGIGYHFEEEIEEALHHIYVTYGESFIENDNLHNTSLWFRLLRQQGFNISSEIFKNYIDQKINFRESLSNDIQGMLALYEAAYMRVEGEEILDNAIEFTTVHLGKIAKDPLFSDTCRKIQIQEALQQPIRKRLARLEALRFIPFYEQQVSHNKVLLKLAKLDFNLLQSLHRKELSESCKWWKGLDISKNLPYVRDRLAEGFFWILGIYFEPQHSRARIFLIKACMLLVIIDDTYDNYGTYEELETFTEAVQRWSLSCLEKLPDYMKLIYQEFLNIHKEMEEILENEGKAYQCYYVKEMLKEYVRFLLKEAKWVKEGYIPTVEEHMSVSLVTCSYGTMVAKSYVGGGDIVTEETFKWVATYPPLVKASCLIFRLMDDVGTHKEEQERNHVASSVECYMKQHGVSEEETCQVFEKQVEDAWKVLNRESLRPTPIPMPLTLPPINLARVCDVFYIKGGNGYNQTGKEIIPYIKSLFVNPMIV